MKKIVFYDSDTHGEQEEFETLLHDNDEFYYAVMELVKKYGDPQKI